MTDELFKPETPAAPTFEDLVGEGKKFADADALARAKAEADAFIERLKAENAEARAELQARLNLEELADKVVQRAQAKPQADPPHNQRQEPALETPEEKINLQEEVQRILRQEREQADRKGNLDKSIAGLKELYGADYQAALNKVAADLGVTKEYLTEMASTTPTGFLKVVSSVVPADDNRPVTPPVSQGGSFTPPSNIRKNSAYYSELRRTDPKAYFSKKVQQEMAKEARAQGDAFYT